MRFSVAPPFEIIITRECSLFLEILREAQLAYNGPNKQTFENVLLSLPANELDELSAEITQQIRSITWSVSDQRPTLRELIKESPQKSALQQVIDKGKEIVTRYILLHTPQLRDQYSSNGSLNNTGMVDELLGVEWGIATTGEKPRELEKRKVEEHPVGSLEEQLFGDELVFERLKENENGEDELEKEKEKGKEKEQDYRLGVLDDYLDDYWEGENPIPKQEAGEKEEGFRRASDLSKSKRLTRYIPTHMELEFFESNDNELRFQQECLERILLLRPRFPFQESRKQLEKAIEVIQNHLSYFVQIYNHNGNFDRFHFSFGNGPMSMINEILEIVDDIEKAQQSQCGEFELEETNPFAEALSLSIIKCREDDYSVWQAVGLFLGLSSKGLDHALGSLKIRNPNINYSGLDVRVDEPDSIAHLCNFAIYYQRPIVVFTSTLEIEMFLPGKYAEILAGNFGSQKPAVSVLDDLLGVIATTANDSLQAPEPEFMKMSAELVRLRNADFEQVKEIPNAIYLIERNEWLHFDAAVKRA